jgi:hypothetical protein
LNTQKQKNDTDLIIYLRDYGDDHGYVVSDNRLINKDNSNNYAITLKRIMREVVTDTLNNY